MEYGSPGRARTADLMINSVWFGTIISLNDHVFTFTNQPLTAILHLSELRKFT